ncbi:MAG: cysteine desulfurase [Planctomycetes bacterium]|nr:cysteine desulfurase [Planctomycetota bacterium]MCB9909620.1 cysteine desulfurase [Planctomycetota bacterium]MCB9911891.1 cysteine desulfurase [Planctomycetota bacterium]HPF14614.1 cysteine desulfurase family protein [Planctomycetota bacterium]
MEAIYLDNAASTPVAEAVRQRMLPFLGIECANPSTRYASGVRAAAAIEAARRKVQRVLCAQDHQVIFTAGGTEANNLAVLGAARSRGPGSVWIGATEHASVRRPSQALAQEGHQVRTLPLDAQGGLDLERALASIGPDTTVVAHMLVNNEVGTRYAIAPFFAAVRRKAPRAHLHVDCIQGLGKLDLSLEELNADSLSISAHKVHGPKGSGALVLHRNAKITPLIHGGPHEGGLRAGTENVAGIVGLAEAVHLASEHQLAFVASAEACRHALDAGLRRLAGFQARRTTDSVASIVSLTVPGAPGEVWQHHLEEFGLEVGLGSACQSKSGEISPALKALGLPDRDVRQVLRISFSRTTSVQEVQALVDALERLVPRLAEVPA